MTTTRSALIEADIRRLVKGTAPEERALAAQSLCQQIDRPDLSPKEEAEAGEILRLIAGDAAEQVRQALALTLRASPLVPRDVANRLARDIEHIAEPILCFSPAFTDDDLSELVRIGGPVRQLAIARRATLSETVTGAIAQYGFAETVRTACQNKGAAFSEAGLLTAVDRFEQADDVLAALAMRERLPASVLERVIGLVTDEARERLVLRYALAPTTADVIASGARERATLDLVDQAGRSGNLPAFVSHLNRQRKLTPSLLLRALANGYMAFFEWGLAELAGMPHHRTWLLVHDAGERGLRANYERAGLPAKLLPAFRAGVDAYHSLSLDGAQDDARRFQRRMLERFLTRPQAALREDLDYLLDKMDRLSPEEAASSPSKAAEPA